MDYEQNVKELENIIKKYSKNEEINIIISARKE